MWVGQVFRIRAGIQSAPAALDGFRFSSSLQTPFGCIMMSGRVGPRGVFMVGVSSNLSLVKTDLNCALGIMTFLNRYGFLHLSHDPIGMRVTGY